MAAQPDTVAVLGIGTMGHGMATSALRAGIPTIVWNREPEATRDLAELGAEVAETAADAARRAAIVVTMVTDADAVISIARDQGMLAALAPGAIWVQMSTIGVAGIERVAALVEKRASRHHAPRRAGLGKQGAGRAGPADDLRVRARRGPRPRHSPLRRARPAHDLGRSGRERHTTQAREQHLARVRRRRRSTRRSRSRTGWGSRPRRSSTRSAAARSCLRGRRPSCNASSKGDFSPQFPLSLALKDVHLALEAADDGPVRRARLAWPTNGSASSTRDSATRTSPS